MKTLDITAKEWFDKVNGNSYFSAEITTDYGTEKEQTYLIPFTYGYGAQYETEAKAVLTEANRISANYGQSLSKYCQDNNIKYNTNKITGCKKKELLK